MSFLRTNGRRALMSLQVAAAVRLRMPMRPPFGSLELVKRWERLALLVAGIPTNAERPIKMRLEVIA